MDYNKLLDISASELMHKFGKGNHKPGSGSAAAFNAILSSNLTLTVIKLTLEPKRDKKYGHLKEEFETIIGDIENSILPCLEHLFVKDSEQFDLSIQKRDERDNEKNQKIKNELNHKALEELKKSTELIIKIADHCVQLSKYALTVFERGFRSARGDSSVALNSALSGLSGCADIISLNLSSFKLDEWTRKTSLKRDELLENHNYLIKKGLHQSQILSEEAELKNRLSAKFDKYGRLYKWKHKFENKEIEKLARDVQNTLWQYRKLLWQDKNPENPLEVLKPEKVIKKLNYSFEKKQTLGVNKSNEEIAGIINKKNCSIKISSKYNKEVVNFTTAHELGHALLHDKMTMHRDIPIDGSEENQQNSIIERQANKFAVYFLMPSKTVSQYFFNCFGCKVFEVNNDSLFKLGIKSHKEFTQRFSSKRELSRYLAGCEVYNFQPFISLSKTFKVSVEAMAIRLEELELVNYK